MGSSAQNSSGVHWCRRQVRFNEVPRRFRRFRRLWCRAKSGSTGFGAEPGQVQQAGFRRRFRRKAKSGSTGFPEKVGEAFVQGQVRFNRVPEKVLDKAWEALVRSQVRFNRIPEKVPVNVPVKVWEALVQSQAGSTGRVPEKVPEKSQVRFNRVSGEGRGGFCAGPGQVQQGSGEGSGQGLGGFGAEPGQVQQDSGEGSGERSGEGLGSFGEEPGQVQQAGFRRRFRRKAKSGSTGFPEKVGEAFVQGQVRFNRVPEKVLQTRLGRLWCGARSGSTGFRRRFR